MVCPVCDRQMLILEFRDVEVDYCTDCRGVWLDQGELELIAQSHGEELPPWEMAGTKKSSRRCPRCNTKMRAGLDPATGIEIDLCPKDHGFWFDKGELESILKASGCEGIAQKLSEYFGSVFGSKQQE